ncbi:MAG: outer membrane protein assembly factor BamD [Prevotella sp.]|nr:outer membrane protein assembly factor BamD [Prevotella sp.]
MKIHIISLTILVTLLSSCASEFNRVYKTVDNDYKYEYAKECFARGKFNQAITLLQELVTIQKGTDNAQECLYMLAMAEYCDRDYESASATFKKYYQTYPKGVYAEQASFYIGQSLYQSTPEPRLDQSSTVNAISAYQDFLDFFPESNLKSKATERLFELTDKLVMKEYLSAKLYYTLGDYFLNCTFGGSNYEACIVTSENALKTYPFTKMREDFAVLIMKSKYELARQSVEEKKLERYRDAEDECYGFLNEYPDSPECKNAEKYIKKCREITGSTSELE